jgi:hypothetical protein
MVEMADATDKPAAKDTKQIPEAQVVKERPAKSTKSGTGSTARVVSITNESDTKSPTPIPKSKNRSKSKKRRRR